MLSIAESAVVNLTALSLAATERPDRAVGQLLDELAVFDLDVGNAPAAVLVAGLLDRAPGDSVDLVERRARLGSQRLGRDGLGHLGHALNRQMRQKLSRLLRKRRLTSES